MYPSWRYHRTLPARIVQDPEEDEALGDEWAGTPAAFLDDAPAAPDEPPAESDDSEKTATTKKKRAR